ncbi:unnamed protein product [Cuscuta campestris]|uniref:Uncharacterized protein n=1 Tax=Cuscuta campestris TaxID=132261 RepID=A0A484LQH9_9ASTE|nr:unnamed protein product [Cuscuta campestris]
MSDLSLLEYLDKPDEQLSAVWALAPPLSSKPNPSFLLNPPLLPQDGGGGGKEAKGSRFAKFIADRKEWLKKEPQVDNSGGTSQNKYISSKL